MFDSKAGNIHISSDEGKSWKLAAGIPEGSVARLVEHPFGHSMAFAVGNDETHWVTNNRGESWQSWKLDAEQRTASLGGTTLSFHATKPGEC